MQVEEHNKIKRVAILALFSEKELSNALVLKGGNVLDLIYDINHRFSMDLDFSIEGDFRVVRDVQEKLKQALESTFKKHGYEVFDVSLKECPPLVSDDMAHFWGGYKITFKVIRSTDFVLLSNNPDMLRMQALTLGKRQAKPFEIDISKFEFCEPKISASLDGKMIYVYTPEMILFEKLRAICQQLPGYSRIVNSPNRRMRAKDFFDIHSVCNALNPDLTTARAGVLLGKIFQTKRVPLFFLSHIEESREFHRPDFRNVELTVKPGYELRDFDFYFDYVLEKADQLKPFWEVEPPPL